MSFHHNSVLADNEPDWGSIDKTALPRLAFADMGEAEKKSTWSYPHHWVKGGGDKDANGVYTTGTLYLHRGGLNAAWAAAQGAHTGKKASQAVIDHLEKHRKALGLDDGDDKNSREHWNRVMTAHTLAGGTPPAGRKIGVDREKKIIYGAVMAQRGPFKSEGRGEFDDTALQLIHSMAANAPNGLKSRLAHPDESNDGIGKLLGRWKDPFPSTVGPRESEGSLKTDTVPCIRGDLHLDPSASKGDFDMADWLMTAAESDPQAISSSLVLKTDKEFRADAGGMPMMDDDGNELPPLWRPLALHACDIVDTGDAVDGLLGKQFSGTEQLAAGELPNGILWKASAMLDRHFAGKPRQFVSEHLAAYVDRYLRRRFGLGPFEDPNELPGVDDVPHAHDPEKDDPPMPPESAKHDGCRSTLAYHHLTMCRMCKAEISGCGCDHREMESRVVTMAKEPCAECMKKITAGGDLDYEAKPAQSDDNPQVTPDTTTDPPSDPENPQGVSADKDKEHARRCRQLAALAI